MENVPVINNGEPPSRSCPHLKTGDYAFCDYCGDMICHCFYHECEALKQTCPRCDKAKPFYRGHPTCKDCDEEINAKQK